MYAPHAAETKASLERDTYSLKHLTAAFKGRNIYELSASDITQYKQKRRAAGASPATINREIGLPSAAINLANKAHDLQLPNPFAGQRYNASQTPPRERFLSIQEAQALIRAAEQSDVSSSYLPDFIRLILNTGLRKGEALNLEWARVDLHKNIILLRSEDQKGRRMSRIPLNNTAVSILLRRRALPGDYVFSRRDGTQIKSVKKSFASAVKNAGIEHCTIHDLRRTAGSWMIQNGVDLATVADVLRHRDIHVAKTIYAFLLDRNLRDAVDKLDGV